MCLMPTKILWLLRAISDPQTIATEASTLRDSLDKSSEPPFKISRSAPDATQNITLKNIVYIVLVAFTYV